MSMAQITAYAQSDQQKTGLRPGFTESMPTLEHAIEYLNQANAAHG